MMCLLPALLLGIAVTKLHAQDRQVNFQNRRIAVKDALAGIKDQTGYLLAINHGGLDEQRVVMLSAAVLPVRTALEEIFAGSGHTWLISENYILIYPDRKVRIPAPVVSLAPQPTVQAEPRRPLLSRVETGSTPVLRARADELITKELPRYEMNFAGVENRDIAREVHPPVVALKINALYGGATLTPNLRMEIGLSRRTTLELGGAWNPWNRKGSYDDNDKLVHWNVMAEFRYWLCERYNEHFFGVHPFFVRFNVGGHDVPLLFDKEYRNDGHAVGIGLSYGYHWMWSKHWGMEFNVGAGVAFLDYEKYGCAKCSDKIGDFKKTYVGPTRLGINMVYLF